MDTSYRTGKAVDRFWGADVGDVAEHPVQDAYLGNAGDQCGDHLNFEKELWGNFHVVTQLEIGGEFDALCRADVAVRHEDLPSSLLAEKLVSTGSERPTILATGLPGNITPHMSWQIR